MTWVWRCRKCKSMGVIKKLRKKQKLTSAAFSQHRNIRKSNCEANIEDFIIEPEIFHHTMKSRKKGG